MNMGDADKTYFENKLNDLKTDLKSSIEESGKHIKEVIQEKIISVETGVRLNSENISEIKKEVKENNDTIIRIGTELRNHKENHTTEDNKKSKNIGFIITISGLSIGWILSIIFFILRSKP